MTHTETSHEHFPPSLVSLLALVLTAMSFGFAVGLALGLAVAGS